MRRRRVEELYKVSEMAAFGDFSRAEIAALGALLDYVELTQKSDLKHFARPQKIGRGGDGRHRSRDAAQSGTDAHFDGRKAGQLAWRPSIAP